MSNQNIVERIRKLLRLSKSPNENEALAAAAKAQELLAAYNLDMADIGDTSHQDMFEIDDGYVTASQPWRRVIAANVAVLYFCDHFYEFNRKWTDARKCGYVRSDRHHFVGQRHNIIVTKEMFAYLCDTIERLTREARARMHNQLAKGELSSFATSFRNACADRVGQRLYAKYLEQTRTPPAGLVTKHKTTLPALYQSVEKALEQFMTNVAPMVNREAKSRAVSKSVLGIAEGMAAGDGVSLDMQVEHDKADLVITKTQHASSGD